MKNYDEMYQSVLSKYDEYLEKKKKRMLAIRRTVPVLACLCFVAILGLGHWNHYQKFPDIPIQPSVIDETTIEITDTTTTTQINAETELVSTIVPVSTLKTERVTTTIGKQIVTTCATKGTEVHTTDQVTAKQTESQISATTVPVTEIKPIVNTPTTTTVTQASTECQITEPPTTTKVISIQEFKIGYYDANYNKPLPSARIALKSKSFCYIGERLPIDVAKGDGAFHPQDYNSNKIYKYSVFLTENNSPITDEKLIVNGEAGGYMKEYIEEEMQAFDINGKYYDYDAYQHEITEIDFKNYSVGSSGCITFSFMAVFIDDSMNPSTSSMQQNLYFYVGEKGIAISPLSVEKAMAEYNKIGSLF